VRTPHALFKRTFLSTYLTPTVSPTTLSPAMRSAPSSPRSLASSTTLAPPRSASSLANSLTGSIVGALPFPSSPLVGSRRPDGALDGGFYTSWWDNEQGDMSRLQLTLNALNEVNEHCWKGDYCELCQGVRAGLETFSGHLARESDEAEQRVSVILLYTKLPR
jgi:sorting nexin-8